MFGKQAKLSLFSSWRCHLASSFLPPAGKIASDENSVEATALVKKIQQQLQNKRQWTYHNKKN